MPKFDISAPLYFLINFASTPAVWFFLALILILVFMRGFRGKWWLISFVLLWILASVYSVGTNAILTYARLKPEQEIRNFLLGGFRVFSGLSAAALILFVFSLKTGRDQGLGRLLFLFNGRANRFAYWMITLALGAVTLGFEMAMFPFTIYTEYRGGEPTHRFELQFSITHLILGVCWTLLAIWPRLAITVKRLHDRGKSGWFVLIGLIPLVGPLWLLIECGLLPGTPGPNPYDAQIPNPQLTHLPSASPPSFTP